MLIAIVDFSVAADHRTAALTALLDEVPTVSAMAGCLRFRPHIDPTNESGLGVLHEWEDAASFAAYLGSASFARLGEVLRPLMTAPPQSRRFEATPLEEVTAPPNPG